MTYEYFVRLCASGCFFFQAEDGIRDLVRSRGLGDVYKRQARGGLHRDLSARQLHRALQRHRTTGGQHPGGRLRLPAALRLSLIHI